MSKPHALPGFASQSFKHPSHRLQHANITPSAALCIPSPQIIQAFAIVERDSWGKGGGWVLFIFHFVFITGVSPFVSLRVPIVLSFHICRLFQIIASLKNRSSFEVLHEADL